ncbi:hypothetical protein C0993_009661 [Termitomyces sp. T159_Od127]|nr:hypothetical protein C0993_009661 [Termitomyces sp. T159_Od127]
MLCTTNPHIDWQHLTLHFDQQALESPELIPFDVTTPVSTADHPLTPLQLRSKSTQLSVIDAQLGDSLKVLTALINSGATGIFVSNQLDLPHNPLDKPLELQLFDSKPTTTRPMTKCHSSSIVLNNSLQFPVSLLGTSACFATVHLSLQPTNNSSKAGATSASTAPSDNSSDPPPPQPVLSAPPAFPPTLSATSTKAPTTPPSATR